jgi:hypothetical protein
VLAVEVVVSWPSKLFDGKLLLGLSADDWLEQFSGQSTQASYVTYVWHSYSAIKSSQSLMPIFLLGWPLVGRVVKVV